MDERNFEELLRSALPAGTNITITFSPKEEIDRLKHIQQVTARPGEATKPPCMVSSCCYLKLEGDAPKLTHAKLLVQRNKPGRAYVDLKRRIVDKDELRSVLRKRGFQVGEGYPSNG